MKTWKIELEMTVADSWIEDGFDATDEAVKEEIKWNCLGLLPWAHETEVKIDNLKITEI